MVLTPIPTSGGSLTSAWPKPDLSLGLRLNEEGENWHRKHTHSSLQGQRIKARLSLFNKWFISIPPSTQQQAQSWKKTQERRTELFPETQSKYFLSGSGATWNPTHFPHVLPHALAGEFFTTEPPGELKLKCYSPLEEFHIFSLIDLYYCTQLFEFCQ